MLDPVTLLNDEANSLTNDGRRHQVSCRKELIGWIQRLKPQDAKALFNDHEPLVLRPILQIVERAGTMFLAHARFIMSRIVSGQCDDQFPDSIPFFLRVSRSLHRHIHDQQKLLGMAVRVASLKGDANMAEQIDDINYLTEDTERTLRALEEDVRFLVTTASIREGRIVGLVSKFAFLFLPLSLLATILTLMDPGYIRWAVLGSLTVPFVTVSVYLMFLWKSSDVDSLSSYLPN